MYEYTYNSDLPQKTDFKSLSKFFEGLDTYEWLVEQERRIMLNCGLNNYTIGKAKADMLEHAVLKARTRWACISAESQREKKTESGISYLCEVYDNLVTVRPRYERQPGLSPPDNTGNQIYKFSKRSRKRMMNRARRLNKSKLELPFFATLTYHKNYTDCENSKRHLNTFLERWRKRDPENFEYFWKLEPQKRGAIHYHLAMFISKPLQRLLRIRHRRHLEGNKNFELTCLDAVRLQVQNDWAEVTAEVDGYPVPYTRLKYIRKNKLCSELYRVKGNERTVLTKCAAPRVEYKMEPDIEHRLYGTNVRTVDNWTMFLGYMYKYMQKEIKADPFGPPKLLARIHSQPGRFEAPPARWIAPDLEPLIKRKKTGRFWGFSYGFDFSALKTGIVDHSELKNVNDFCNALNALAFERLTRHLVNNAKRKKQELKHKPRELQRWLDKYRNIFESQKKRYLTQRDKINEGYGLQFEISSEKALQCEKYLRSKSVSEFFDFP